MPEEQMQEETQIDLEAETPVEGQETAEVGPEMSDDEMAATLGFITTLSEQHNNMMNPEAPMEGEAAPEAPQETPEEPEPVDVEKIKSEVKEEVMGEIKELLSDALNDGQE